MHNTVLRHHEIIIIIISCLANLYGRETLFPVVKEECNLRAYAKKWQRVTYGLMIGDVRGDWRNAGNQDIIYSSLQLTIEQTYILLVLMFTSCAQETIALFFSSSVVKSLFILALNYTLWCTFYTDTES
jgi:hypothetical protein